jgi:hypothetical protein
MMVRNLICRRLGNHMSAPMSSTNLQTPAAMLWLSIVRMVLGEQRRTRGTFHPAGRLRQRELLQSPHTQVDVTDSSYPASVWDTAGT